MKQNYYMKESYKARNEYIHYDDRAEEDDWQLEIYLHALGLMKKHGFSRVADIGCGSAYKLITYLGEYETVGLELAENLTFLQEKYPNNIWLESNFDLNSKLDVDVLICSDVVEHIVDPDELIEYIKRISFKYLVISTPERDLVYPKDSEYLNGPPRNKAHQREWNYEEFKNYIASHFDVLDQRVTNLHQATQMIICSKKENDE
ncbi:class I SAM-dependent methyltransferase [bacterium]|nr:class I SAM-dependent methyltransferase [bacterium]